NSIIIGISIFASMLSTISFLSYPGEIIKHGPMLLTGLLAIPFAYVLIGYWLLPVLMRHRATSAYELLEARLGMTGRRLGAIMFLIFRLNWMALLLYMSSMAMVVVLGIDERNLPLVAAVVGLVAVMYTSVGGLRAVVVTDVVQFAILFGGALVTLGTITYNMGGVSAWWPTDAAVTAHWDEQPFWSWDPTVRITMVGMIIMGVVSRLTSAGGDQVQVQRFMATTDAKAARRAFLVTSIAGVFTMTLLSLVGLALMGYFTEHAHLIPASGSVESEADGLYPYFIAAFLPPGISGLVVAALFAAAMSSVDSGVNSISAVVMSDFVEQWKRKPQTQKQHVRFAIVLAFVIGVIVVLLSTLMQYIPGNFTEVTNRAIGTLGAPLFALFVLALFVPFSNSYGAVVGAAYGVSCSMVVAYWGVLTDLPHLSFMWIGPAGLLVNVVVGMAASALTGQVSPRSGRWIISGGFLVLLALIIGGIAVYPWAK
ncbi:MAG: sodium/solute symporter, partial [Phycisphaeraceae bacterium]